MRESHLFELEGFPEKCPRLILFGLKDAPLGHFLSEPQSLVGVSNQCPRLIHFGLIRAVKQTRFRLRASQQLS